MQRLIFLMLGLGFMLAGAAAASGPEIEDVIAEAGLTEGPVAMRDRPGWREPRKIVLRRAYVDIDELRERYPAVEFAGVDTPEEAAAAIQGADALIGFCNDDILAEADRLQWIQLYSAGAEDCVAVHTVRSDEVLLTNMQKMFNAAIGEHAIALMLSLARALPEFARSMPTGAWPRDPAITGNMRVLSGKTVLVVGLGGIGTGAARRAAGLNMRVIATRNSSREGPDFVDYVGLPDELLELAAEADVVINALPWTRETDGLIDSEFFDAVKPGALFVNVGRGATVDTDALVAALRDGRIGGAGLDVTEPEPLPPDHVLWRMDRVIITPHVAGWGSEREHFPVLVEENLRRFMAGDALLNVVDPDRGY